MSQASAPFQFKAVVKSDPARLLKGQLQCRLTAEGLRLQQASKIDLLLPVGTRAECLKGGRFRVPIDGRAVELAIASWTLYPHRLARDLCAFLHGQRPPLQRTDYAIPPYLYVPAMLPLGIPILMRGGAIWGALGLGLAGGCLTLVRREQWPAAARLVAALGLSVVGYAALFIFLLQVAKPAWLVSAPPEKAAPAEAPAQRESGQGDIWMPDVDPATGKVRNNDWNDKKPLVLLETDQDKLPETPAPKPPPGEPVALKHANEPVNQLAFAPDGQTLATVDGRGTCRLWDTATGKERTSFILKGGRAGWLAFSPDGKFFMAWDGNGDPELRSPETGAVLRSLDRSGMLVGYDMDGNFSPDGKLFAGLCGGKIRFWRIPDGETVNFPHVSETLAKQKRILHFMRFGLDSKTLITTSAGEDGHGPGMLRRFEEVWNLEKPGPPRLLTGFTDPHSINALHLSLDRKLVLSCGNTVAEALDWTTDRVVARIKGNRIFMKSLALTPDGRTLIVGHGAIGAGIPNLSLWDSRSLKLIAAYQTPAGGMDTRVAVSGDGKLLAVASGNTASIWNLDTILGAK